MRGKMNAKRQGRMMKDSVTVCAGERASYSLAETRDESQAGRAHQVMQIDTHSYNKPTALPHSCRLVLEDTHPRPATLYHDSNDDDAGRDE